MKGERGICPVCGGTYGVYPPAGGDGTARRLRSHKFEDSKCFGRFSTLWTTTADGTWVIR